jgi:hypothetical protein
MEEGESANFHQPTQRHISPPLLLFTSATTSLYEQLKPDEVRKKKQTV